MLTNRRDNRTRSNDHDKLPSASPTVPPHASIISASALAAKPDQFALWTTRVKLDPDIKGNIPVDFFNPIRHMKHVGKRFPRWLSDETSPQFAHVAPSYPAQIKLLSTTLSKLPGASGSNTDITGHGRQFDLHDEPDLELIDDIGAILQTSQYHEQLFERALPPNETDLQGSITDLINRVYNRGDLCTCILHIGEQRLKLPRTDLKNVSISSITSDAIDIMLFPGPWPIPYDDYDSLKVAQEALSCLYQPELPENLVVVHCVMAYKRQSISRPQALMGMVSALYQRQALGITDQFVFGVLRHPKGLGTFQVLASAWCDGQIQVCLIGIYVMSCPVSTLQFYLVLREIKRLGALYYDRIQRLESFPLSGLQNSTWAPYVPPRRQDSPQLPASGEEGRNTGPSGLAGILEAFGECGYYDKVANFLNTTSFCDPPDPTPTPPENDDYDTGGLAGITKECNYHEKVANFLETIRPCDSASSPPGKDDCDWVVVEQPCGRVQRLESGPRPGPRNSPQSPEVPPQRQIPSQLPAGGEEGHNEGPSGLAGILATFEECDYNDKVVNFLAGGEEERNEGPSGLRTILAAFAECNYKDKVANFLDTISPCDPPPEAPENDVDDLAGLAEVLSAVKECDYNEKDSPQLPAGGEQGPNAGPSRLAGILEAFRECDYYDKVANFLNTTSFYDPPDPAPTPPETDDYDNGGLAVITKECNHNEKVANYLQTISPCDPPTIPSENDGYDWVVVEQT